MSAIVDAHNNGDCWPSNCPICAHEDELHEAECQPCTDASRCDECGERMCIDGPEPRMCGTTCRDCACQCQGCMDERADLTADSLRHFERDKDIA